MFDNPGRRTATALSAFYCSSLKQAMRFSFLFFLLLTACLYLTMAQGAYENCCLKYVKRVKSSTKRAVISYWMQETDGSCNISAVIFQMKNRRAFCANPEAMWVKHLINVLDRRAKSTR
ncbi:C-C motif chemokine 20-like [Arapaima gigas]